MPEIPVVTVADLFGAADLSAFAECTVGNDSAGFTGLKLFIGVSDHLVYSPQVQPAGLNMRDCSDSHIFPRARRFAFGSTRRAGQKVLSEWRQGGSPHGSVSALYTPKVRLIEESNPGPATTPG